MNFEKALEAMRQGNKVRMKDFPNTLYFIDDGFIKIFDRVNEESNIVPDISYATVLAGDWEIYEEPQKEPEITTVELLYALYVLSNVILQEHDNEKKLAIYGVPASHVLEALNIAEKEIRKMAKSPEIDEFIQKKLKSTPEQKEPQTEKNHVGYSTFLTMNQYGGEFSENQLKKEMRQALSRKFFKLEEEDYDVNADYELDNLNTVISNMLNIYQFLFPEGENK